MTRNIPIHPSLLSLSQAQQTPGIASVFQISDRRWGMVGFHQFGGSRVVRTIQSAPAGLK